MPRTPRAILAPPLLVLVPTRRSFPTFRDGAVKPDAVTAGVPASDRPLLSDSWTRNVTWRGVGPMPETERATLHEIVDRAHAAGYRVRFWATPDTPGPAPL